MYKSTSFTNNTTQSASGISQKRSQRAMSHRKSLISSVDRRTRPPPRWDEISPIHKHIIWRPPFPLLPSIHINLSLCNLQHTFNPHKSDLVIIIVIVIVVERSKLYSIILINLPALRMNHQEHQSSFLGWRFLDLHCHPQRTFPTYGTNYWQHGHTQISPCKFIGGGESHVD